MGVVRLATVGLGAALFAACGSGAEQAAPEETAAASPPAAAGQRPAAFALCASCHAVEPGRHGVGPSLHDVVGRAAGSLPDYNYSAAMKAFARPWSDAELDAYLAKPTGHIPGTKMIFPGMPDAARRKAVIDYLATL